MLTQNFLFVVFILRRFMISKKKLIPLFLMRKALLLATVLVVATAAAVKAQAPLSPKKMNAAKEAALATVNIEAAKAHISFLASDELRGRKAGTNDAQVAAHQLLQKKL